MRNAFPLCNGVLLIFCRLFHGKVNSGNFLRPDSGYLREGLVEFRILYYYCNQLLKVFICKQKQKIE